MQETNSNPKPDEPESNAPSQHKFFAVAQETRQVDPAGMPTLLKGGMRPDLHWFPEDVSAERLAAVLVGMANTTGGTILVGVAPRSGQVHGVSAPEGILDRVFQAALLAEPTLVLPVPRIQKIDHMHVVVIFVPRGLPNVYSLEGRYLGRDGAQTNPLPARRLRQLLVERGVVQLEVQTPANACLDDLDPDKVAAYVETLGLPASELPEEVLLRRGCLRRSVAPLGKSENFRDSLQPTYAALLMFGHHPQQWLPNATILAARFSGTNFADRYLKQDISGTLPDQLRQAEAFVHDNLRRVVRLVGLTHEEVPEYPLDAVRELLVNAVAHRDYNQQGDTIHLNIFADRIEVHSPGGLPGPVTLENLLQARFSRNAVIVQVLSDLGFIERLGYGLDRVVTAMRRSGLRPPRFEEVAGTFRVTLFGESENQNPNSVADLSSFKHMDLNPRQELALMHLNRYQRITNREFQELCPDVHPETLRRDLVDLVSRSVLIKVGDKKATYYILK